MSHGLVTVFGGSGFIGRHIVRRLAASGHRVRVAVRDVELARFLKPMGDVGQVVPMAANLRHDDSVAAAVDGADAVVISVGVLFSRGPQTFEQIHVDGPARVARSAAAAGISRLVHISAIGADPASPSAYARSKAGGEAAVRAAVPTATILRPSVVFGAEDSFFNRFAALARLAPALPVFGHGFADAGSSRMQPVFVGDVAAAACRCVADPATAGRTYELGGPRAYTYREIMELVMDATGRRRPLVPVPFAVAAVGAFFAELLPSPPLTRDQLHLLAVDNVVAPGAPGLADLGIASTPVDTEVPDYLARYRRAGRVSAGAG
jgi:uncharacterized protein YbjT (DUF2867 family)